MKKLLSSASVLAANDTNINLQPGGSPLLEGVQGLTVPEIIAGFLRLTLVVAAVVFFFILVIGGIKWIMSGGDKAHTEAARNQITAALVGLVIVFAAWAIASLLGTFFGVGNILNLEIQPIQ